MIMLRVVSFLAPLATLLTVWVAFLFSIFVVPLLLILPFLTIGLCISNVKGVRWAWKGQPFSGQWFLWVNALECLWAVWLLSWLLRP